MLFCGGDPGAASFWQLPFCVPRSHKYLLTVHLEAAAEKHEERPVVQLKLLVVSGLHPSQFFLKAIITVFVGLHDHVLVCTNQDF